MASGTEQEQYGADHDDGDTESPQNRYVEKESENE